MDVVRTHDLGSIPKSNNTYASMTIQQQYCIRKIHVNRNDAYKILSECRHVLGDGNLLLNYYMVTS
jgi:hypothetical protein